MLNINNLDLEKAIRKSTKIAKEKYDTLKLRTNRKLRIKVKKPVLKVSENCDNEF